MKSIKEIERLKMVADKAWENYVRTDSGINKAFKAFDKARTAYVRASEEK